MQRIYRVNDQMKHFHAQMHQKSVGSGTETRVTHTVLLVKKTNRVVSVHVTNHNILLKYSESPQALDKKLQGRKSPRKLLCQSV